MKRTSLILIAVFTLVMLPAAFGQGTPSQSQDPSAQPPAQQTPGQDPSQTPSTSSPSSSPTSSGTDTQKNSFVGSITKANGKFMLHTGGADYDLDDQSQAAKYEGKSVKVSGQLDQSSSTIRVQSIEPASSM